MGKKTKTILLLIIGIVIVGLLGLSYAYFQLTVIIGNNTNNTMLSGTVSYGQVRVTYENGNDTIQAAMVDLIETEPNVFYNYMVKFDIQNTGDVSQNVVIRWENINNEFCQYTDDDYRCTGTGNFVGDELSYSLYACSSQEYAGVTDASSNVLFDCDKLTPEIAEAVPTSDSPIADVSVAANSRTYYVLIVSIENIDGIQNYQMNKDFKGSVYVDYGRLVYFAGNTLEFEDSTKLGYRIMTDNLVMKIASPATTSKGAVVWLPNQAEWETEVCDANSTWYSSSHCPYCDPANASYNATTCTSRYNANILNKYIAGENGIFATPDNDGISYYYRGGEGCSIVGANLTSTYTTATACIANGGYWVGIDSTSSKCYANGTPEVCEEAGGTWTYLNNNVSFAGFNWKIVRINGDGSIRIVLNGFLNTVKRSGLNVNAGEPGRFTNVNKTPSGSSHSTDEPLALEIASYDGGEIESKTNLFYTTYIDTTSLQTGGYDYHEYLADSLFCNDINWRTQPATGQWTFQAYGRIMNALPSLQCPTNSIYKVQNSPGETLDFPIATLTADEMMFAGAIQKNNTSFYLMNPLTVNNWELSMTPDYWSSDNYVFSFGLSNTGYLSNIWSNYSYGIRPVLNLKSGTSVLRGTGTTQDPYVIAE